MPTPLANRLLLPTNIEDARFNRNLAFWMPARGDWKDYSGHGHVPTVSGAFMAADRYGREQRAGETDGVDDYAEYPDHPALRLQPPFTMSLVLYRGDESRDQSPLSKYTGQSGSWKSYGIDINPTNLWQFRVENKALNQFPIWRSASVLNVAKWYHLVAVCKGFTGSASDVNLYTDGVKESVTLLANGYTNGYVMQHGSTPLGLGVRENDTRTAFLKGRLADVRIWPIAFGESEVARLTLVKVR